VVVVGPRPVVTGDGDEAVVDDGWRVNVGCEVPLVKIGGAEAPLLKPFPRGEYPEDPSAPAVESCPPAEPLLSFPVPCQPAPKSDKP